MEIVYWISAIGGVALMCFGSAGTVASYLSPEPMKTFMLSVITGACGLAAFIVGMGGLL